MNGGSRGAWLVVLGCVVTAAACGLWPTFPEDSLHPPRDAGPLDGSVTDIGRADVRDVPVTDTSLPDSTAPTDIADSAMDADVMDVKPPTDADLCTLVPSVEVASTRVGDGVMGAHDLTIDALGRLAVGVSNQVQILDPTADGGAPSPLVTGLGGEVRSLRYTGNGLLALAVELSTDGGDPDGVISVAPSLGGSPEVRVPRVARPGGVAIDRANGIWYSNTATGRVYRFVPSAIGTDAGADAGADSMPTSLVTDVTVPTYLAFSADNNTLFITNTVGTLFRVSITRDAGTITVSTSSPVAGGLGNISGLAVDECNNAYISDISRNVIRRISPSGTITNLATDVMMPRGLAFGQGTRFPRTTLYTLSEVDGSVHAIETVAAGVLLPSP